LSGLNEFYTENVPFLLLVVVVVVAALSLLKRQPSLIACVLTTRRGERVSPASVRMSPFGWSPQFTFEHLRRKRAFLVAHND